MKWQLIAIACVLGVGGTSCATAQVPDKNYTPNQTIAAAEERGAEELPEARLHLKLARDQLTAAKKLKDKGLPEEANIKLLKAQSDADYALALLRHKAEKEEEVQVRKKLERLRKELEQTKEE